MQEYFRVKPRLSRSRQYASPLSYKEIGCIFVSKKVYSTVLRQIQSAFTKATMLEMIVDYSTRSVFLQRLVSCMEPHLSSCMYSPYMHAGGVSAATFCFIASSSLAVMCFIMFVWKRKTHTVTPCMVQAYKIQIIIGQFSFESLHAWRPKMQFSFVESIPLRKLLVQ